MAWLHAVIDVPARLHGSAADFWERALGWPLGDQWPDHPELRSFEPPRAEPYVHLQAIEGAPRVHFDMESDDPRAAIDRAVAGGAELRGRFERRVALRSPGGLPFCVLPAAARVAPEPVEWESGHRSRLVQVSIDSPATCHDHEVAFWRGLLGGRWVGYSSPEFAEFAGKWHDDAGSPLQLLFQQVDEPDGEVRAHLDLGTDGRPAEVRRLLDLGAQDVGRGTAGGTCCGTPRACPSAPRRTPRSGRPTAT